MIVSIIVIIIFIIILIFTFNFIFFLFSLSSSSPFSFPYSYSFSSSPSCSFLFSSSSSFSFPSSFSFSFSWRSSGGAVKGTVRRQQKNAQPFLQHCCKTSSIAMLCVLPPTKTNLATWFVARQVRTWVVKRATSVFNSFCSNVAKRVARFLLPVLL